ncbi:MAG TPA: PAS domain S-box protein [Thermoplasmatales archaeon]|nr:PAS domain S-box protein [Thermoplasmatales archaeon]
MAKLPEVVLGNLDEVIHVVDKNMRILFINRAIEHLSKGKIKAEDAIGKNLYDVFPFLKEKGVDKQYERVFSTGRRLRTEEEIDYYGEKIYTVTTKIPIKDGKTRKVITIMRDVTALKKTEESLREMAEKYSTIVELAREGICIDDENERMTFVNDAFARILGYENKEELIGKKLLDFVDNEGKKILNEEINSRRKNKSGRYELKIYAKDGKPKDILVSSTPLIVNGKYAGSISVNLDITELKKAENEMKRALEEERKFKADTAHYFFNPLCIAKGYLVLAMKDEVDAEQREKLKAIINAVERVENVVKNVVIKGEVRE